MATLRAETPGCAEVVHLNNAGAALQPAVVADTVRRYLDDEVRIGGYETADKWSAELEDCYSALASLIGCSAHELAFLGSATRAWQVVFYSLRLGEADEIITTTSEYHSNYVAYLQLRRRNGVVVRVAPNAPTGELDPKALEKMITGRTRVISMNHVPTNSGLVNPAAAVGAIAREHGIPYLLDACQSVGQLPIDVAAIGCDYLTAAGRKYLRGPRGTGFLFVADQRLSDLEPVMIDGHGAPWVGRNRFELRPDTRRFEVWEQNFAGKAGLAVAVRYAANLDVAVTSQRVIELSVALRAQLESINGVVVRDPGEVRCGIVTFTVEGASPEVIVKRLRSLDINTSFATANSARIDMEDRDLDQVVRASVHYYNDDSDLDALLRAVRQIAR